MQQAVVLAVTLVAALAGAAFADNPVPRMGLEELKGSLGRAGVVVVDVRRGGDWEGSAEKIAGAVREDPMAVDTWAGKYAKDGTLVLYCA